MNKILFKLYRLPIPWIIRRIVSKLLSFFIFPRKNYEVVLSSDFKKKSNDLLRNGYVIIDNFLSNQEIDEILNNLSKFQVFDPWDSAKGYFDPSHPPSGTHVGYYKKSDLNTISVFDRIINDPILNSYISTYVGKNFKCTNKASWWTFGNNENPQEAELLHRDIDNILWLKIFVYLTDVDINCGPHVYIPASHRTNKFLRFKRFTDLEAQSEFGDLSYFTGKKGTLIIEDTFGLHKGQHIKSNNNRLIFQLQYSVLNNPLQTA